VNTGPVNAGPTNDRASELAVNLAAVDLRIAQACADAGRDRAEVTLVVVTKTWPASDVRLLAGLGVRDVGENRDQEAQPKAAECADLQRLGLRWHFVGQLQTNKARSVAGFADVVHSVDRPRLADALAHAAATGGRRIGCFLQVSLDGDQRRGGALPVEVAAVAEVVAEAPALELLGLMAVAPLGADPVSSFAALAELSLRLRADPPGATAISAGMSGDLEAAIGAGATHVRVGSAVLGGRPPLR